MTLKIYIVTGYAYVLFNFADFQLIYNKFSKLITNESLVGLAYNESSRQPTAL